MDFEAQKHVKPESVCIPGGVSADPNCDSIATAVTIGCNLSDSSLVLVYVAVKSHMLCGKLKSSSSDLTTVHNWLDTLTKDLTPAHL